jgi:hypothetical protein
MKKIVLQQIPEGPRGSGEFRIQEIDGMLQVDVSGPNEVVSTIRNLGDVLTRGQALSLIACPAYSVTFRAL